ncbi:TssQ family T6SS-associated lipoprotein [Azoarcus sp. L1K30]|uniref:TssQ family T6SS-associated lipoprotein n=1 Tax=Azoarcus sp. L1K30 TaxID=2820277 RepID=UPI001B842328|nr:TssQ family T6SS-associated lipoprotein [Azoarcus sp. L1K30]MBR0565114.1 TssQ family T6SS-associated lipoprotein [Azoarcus sp. L1K30]
MDGQSKPVGLAALLSLLLMGGCAALTQPATAPEAGTDPTPASLPANADQRAESALKAGIGLYERGNYKNAASELNRALDLGLKQPSDTIRARKVLAFIYCSSGQKTNCRREFREALRIDPDFALDKAEAGHPMWGPVFTEVRKDFVADK